eukprot:364373-Chlamydomonas_euryale.AAC.3
MCGSCSVAPMLNHRKHRNNFPGPVRSFVWIERKYVCIFAWHLMHAKKMCRLMRPDCLQRDARRAQDGGDVACNCIATHFAPGPGTLVEDVHCIWLSEGLPVGLWKSRGMDIRVSRPGLRRGGVGVGCAGLVLGVAPRATQRGDPLRE